MSAVCTPNNQPSSENATIATNEPVRAKRPVEAKQGLFGVQ